MADTFKDALSSLIATELLDARSSKDEVRRVAAVIDLAEQLGKAIAIACDGSPPVIDQMLLEIEGYIATSAVETADQVIKINHFFRKGGRK